MSSGGVEVPPLSRKKIRAVAHRVREVFDIADPYFPIVRLLDVVLPQIDNDYTLEICDETDMGPNHGLTIPDQKIIRIREDVYLGAVQGNGRDRMTMAHELGHLVLHHGISLARAMEPQQQPPAFKDSEWQAKAFAGELLICSQHITGCRGATDLAERFGVSFDAAEIQWEAFKKDAVVKK